VSDKRLVLDFYPYATCARFPVVQPTSMPTRFIVKLSPGEPRFATGNTAAQAWRRAYEKILAGIHQQARAAAAVDAGEARGEVREK
jgi:hypothetical protein